MQKIVIIGLGNVGLTYLKTLCMEPNLSIDIKLIDLDIEKLLGEVDDINQALVLKNNSTSVSIGSYNDCDDANIVVITAGVSQSTNSRLDDLEKTNEIIHEIITNVNRTSFSGIYLVASNPLDVITELVAHYADYNYSKVIGTGTMLDTIRLKYLISKKLAIKASDINIYVLGEHGDSQVVAWSNANIGLSNLSCFLTEEEKEELAYQTMKMGGTIISHKGYTSDGIASCLVNLTLAIINDQKIVYPVSNYNSDYGVYLSTPVVIGKNGIERTINIKLTLEEKEKLKESSEIISEALEKILPKELY